MVVATIPLTGATWPYYVSSPTAGQLPYLYANSSANPFGSDLSIVLPSALNGVTSVAPSAPFSFTPAVTSGPNPMPASITLAGQACWNFAAAGAPTPGVIRTALRQAYDQFLLNLELGNVAPQWIRQIQDLIAAYLPSTFQETLYFKYRFDPVNGYLDLLPGMRLRIDFAAYQFIYSAGQGNTDPLLDGFVGSGSSYLNIGGVLTAGGGQSLVFDPFFGAMTRSSVAANQGGAAGLLDLIGGTAQKPYYRLFYPPQIPSSDGPGVSSTTGNITLVGASTLAALQTATTAYLSTQTVPVGNTISASFFRGRATVTPEIGVLIQTRPAYVSLGTTIRQLYSTYSTISRSAGQTFPSASLERSVTAFQYGGTFPNFVLLNPVPNVSNASTAPYPDGTDSLDLPVITGDAYALPVPNQR